MEVKLSALIGSAFGESRKALRSGATELIEQGGRGSGKSSYLSVELLLQLLKHPDCHALALRKVGNTLRTSVYAQLLWAVGALGLTGRFRCSLSPMEMEYLPTGQRILFFGMDDPGKLKSLKLPTGYIGILWFEELDQFDEEEVRSVEQSAFRGGEFSLSLKSFNPPANAAHWVNRLEEKPGRFLHRSTYLELPERWLGSRFLADAEHLKRINPTLYDNEYMGLPVGVGQRVFPNLVLGKVDSSRFSLAVCGVDWGWWPDPWAANRVAFDQRENKLYILEERRRHRIPNRDSARLVADMVLPGELILADGAEPKSIADYRTAGLNCRAAKKGPGSIRYGMKWLQSLEAIVVDPKICPETAKEFSAYCYRDGEYPDGDNHHIDAVRYAAGAFWRR